MVCKQCNSPMEVTKFSCRECGNINIYLLRFRIYFALYFLFLCLHLIGRLYSPAHSLVLFPIAFIFSVIAMIFMILFLFNLPKVCKILSRNSALNILGCLFIPLFLVVIGIYWPTKYMF